MTSAQHPITPPPELVQEWLEDTKPSDNPNSPLDLATRAAQWGADQELEACCHEVQDVYSGGSRLRAARRPKPTSLKEQALKALLHLDHGRHNESCLVIRRALEQLND